MKKRMGELKSEKKLIGKKQRANVAENNDRLYL